MASMSPWFLAACFVFNSIPRAEQSTNTILYPSSSELGTQSVLTEEEKEKFLDEHNKLRGMVDPPAADMEYLVRQPALVSTPLDHVDWFECRFRGCECFLFFVCLCVYY